LNLTNATGVTNVNNAGSTQAGSVTGISSTAVALSLSDTAAGATFAFKAAAVSGSADAATVTLENATGGTLTVASVETLNVVSNTSDNTIAIAADKATTITVTGDAALDTDSATIAAASPLVTKIDGSAMAGKLTVETGALGTSSTTVT
jgi:hypothetical protein